MPLPIHLFTRLHPLAHAAKPYHRPRQDLRLHSRPSRDRHQQRHPVPPPPPPPPPFPLLLLPQHRFSVPNASTLQVLRPFHDNGLLELLGARGPPAFLRRLRLLRRPGAQFTPNFITEFPKLCIIFSFSILQQKCCLMSRFQISSAPKLSHSIEKNEVFSAQVTLSCFSYKTLNPFHLPTILQFNRPFSLRTMIFLTIMAFAVAAAPEELMKVTCPHFTSVFWLHSLSSRLSPPIPWRVTVRLQRQRYEPLT
jgi:hypothetical protein